MKNILNILISLLQLAGTVLVGVGINAICVPLCWIYSGAVLFLFGNLLYRAMESEERKR